MLSSVAAALALLTSSASAVLYSNETEYNHSCVIEPSFVSCNINTSKPIDTCCTETFGGLLLSTQFWDTYTGLEKEGQLLPPNQWTLHGLWPDFCNGSYTQYCDLSRQYDPAPSPNTTNGKPDGTPVPPYKGPNIGTFLKPFGVYSLLDWMNHYWINQGAPNADFWGHEFSKHATCFSTFDVPCYGPRYQKHEEVVDFFETAIMYYLRFPTYDWLKAAGITPSNTTTYTLAKIQSTLTQASGAVPYVGCSGPRYNETAAGAGSTDNGRTQLSELWYYFHVLGRPQEGHSYAVDAGSFNTTCAKAEGAVHYYERTKGSTWTEGPSDNPGSGHGGSGYGGPGYGYGGGYGHGNGHW